jgi:hypothetical protein
VALVDQLVDAAMPQRHQGDLGRHEEGLHENEEEHDQQLQDDVTQADVGVQSPKAGIA